MQERIMARVVETSGRQPVIDEWFGDIAEYRPVRWITVEQGEEIVSIRELHPTVIPEETFEFPNPLYPINLVLARRAARNEAQRLNSQPQS